MQKKSKLNVFAFMMLIILGLTFQPVISTYAACPDDISSYWKLDEGNSPPAYVDFIKGNNGTGAADPTAVAGQINGAQQFDGDAGGVGTTGIDVPADKSFNWAVDESFSIEFWVRRNGATTAEQVVIGRSEGNPGSTLTWWVGIDGTVASFVLGDSDSDSDTEILLGTTDITNDAWYHVVAVRDGDNDENRLYVNGQEESTSPRINATYSAGFDSATADLDIGYWNFQSTTPSNHLGGMIDEVAIYDRALDPVDDIQAHYAAGTPVDDYCSGDAPFVPFPDDTISLWELDEGNNPLAYEDAFNGNNGTGAADPTAVAGQINGAQQFDGDAGGVGTTGIDVPADKSFNWAVDESFSIEFWVRRNGATTAEQVVIGRSEGNPGSTLTWWVGIDGTVASFVLGDSDSDSDTEILLGTTDITNDAWYHVVAVRDGDNDENRLYVNGQEESNSPRINATYSAGFDSATADLNIGYWNFQSTTPSNHLGGMIDEVALYDRALDPVDDILAHYNDGQLGRGVDYVAPASSGGGGGGGGGGGCFITTMFKW